MLCVAEIPNRTRGLLEDSASVDSPKHEARTLRAEFAGWASFNFACPLIIESKRRQYGGVNFKLHSPKRKQDSGSDKGEQNKIV